MRCRLLFTTFLLTFCMQRSGGQGLCSRTQSQADIDRRVDTLIAQMTLPERIAQLQDRAPAIQRLHLPAYNWWNEGLHGLARDGYATVFPQAIGLAATWDPTLLQQVGDTVSSEARAKFNGHGAANTPRYGGLTVWSPNVNIFRDPRWGRGQETYGEDPFLTAAMSSAFVEGVQGHDPFYLKADATPKHFAAHSGPEKGRDSFDSVVSAHDLEDTYLPAFHLLATQANASSLMCSYNEINGVPSCGNAMYLHDLVRGQWGFKGYLVSDCDAVGDIAQYHHYAKNNAQGAAEALNAGVDLDCGNTYAALGESVREGLTTEGNVNLALHRLLVARVHLGMMDPAECTPFADLGPQAIDSPAHRQLALQAAEESIVLLKNNGALPFLAAKQRLAVIGPTADMLKVLEANYHGTASHPSTPLEALRSTFPSLTYAQGSLLAASVSAPVPETALREAQSADAQPGLTAQYFNAPSFDGQPTLTTHVRKIDLDLDRVGPAPAITAKQYAARWSGSLVPPAPGPYTLRVNIERCWDCTTHDAFRLFVDGKLVIKNTGAKGDPDRITLPFTDRQPHALRLELLHTGEDEGIALEWEPPAEALLQQAVSTAKDADAVVAFVGLSPDLEGEALQVELPGFDSGDRTSLDLPAAQRELLRRLESLGKPVVIVLTSGSAVSLGAEADHAAAVLEAWYPGEAGGEAVAAILTGHANPSGRLPVTFYRSASDLPAFTDYSMAHRTYRYFNGPVEYPFGFGLSYSHFVYGPPQIATTSLHAGDPFTATVQVRNAGAIAGNAVAELYLQPPQTAGAPRLALRGIQRVALAPGEARELRFALTPADLSFVSLTGQRTVSAGHYRLFIEGQQPDLSNANGTSFEVNGTRQLQP